MVDSESSRGVGVHYLRTIIIGLGLLGISFQAFALDGATIFSNKGCVNCHGEAGRNPVMPDYPILAGQQRDYLLQQMRDIKSGVRSNVRADTMRTIMKFVSEEEMAALADYLSGLPRTN